MANANHTTYVKSDSQVAYTTRLDPSECAKARGRIRKPMAAVMIVSARNTGSECVGRNGRIRLADSERNVSSGIEHRGPHADHADKGCQEELSLTQ